MKKQLFPILLMLAASIIMSCQKTNESFQLNFARMQNEASRFGNLSYSSLVSRVVTNTDGEFSLSGQSSYADQSNFDVSFQGSYTSDKIDATTSTKINNFICTPIYSLTYNCTSEPALFNIFGSSASFDFFYSKNNQSFSSSLIVELPERLLLPTYQDFQSIESGKKIVWTTEQRVVDDVILIHLSYSSQARENINLPNAPAGSIQKNILVKDADGEYTLTATDLSSFPIGFYIRTDLVRGNFKVLEDNITGRKFVIKNYTTVFMPSSLRR
jgi:hypothetical protein